MPPDPSHSDARWPRVITCCPQCWALGARADYGCEGCGATVEAIEVHPSAPCSARAESLAQSLAAAHPDAPHLYVNRLTEQRDEAKDDAEACSARVETLIEWAERHSDYDALVDRLRLLSTPPPDPDSGESDAR